MDLYQVDFRDFWIRDASEAEYSFGGTLAFDFMEGQRTSGVSVEIGVLLPKGTSVQDARAKVLESARKLLKHASELPDHKVQALILEGQRYDQPEQSQDSA